MTQTVDETQEEDELRVSTLELFFDLVFVFTLTQLTHLLVDHLDWQTAGRVLLVFLLLYWMYAGYAYLTNQVPPDRAPRKLLLVLGMWAFLVCALAIPSAFTADGGLLFGIGYLVVVVVHGAMYGQAYGRSVLWFVPPNLFAAGLVIAGSLLHGWPADALWLAAIAVHLVVTPYLSRFGDRVATTAERQAVARLRAGHFVERHGLLLIVAFGESVVALGVGLTGREIDLGLVAGALVGLVVATALWWAFFEHDEHRSEQALLHAPHDRRFGMGLRSFFYAFVPMLLGIVVFAAGVKKAIDQLGAPIGVAPALALGGGVALYLAGQAAFRLALGIPGAALRAVPAVLAVATVAAGVWVNAGVQFAALVVVLIAMLVVDERVQPTAP